jgi:hypothetical protein
METCWLFIQGYVGECRDIRTIVTAQTREVARQSIVKNNNNREQSIAVYVLHIWEKITFVHMSQFYHKAPQKGKTAYMKATTWMFSLMRATV